MDKPIQYQPDDLLVKFLLGEANAEEITAASNWIAADPDNEKYFHQLRSTWEFNNTVTPLAQPDENEAWLRFQKRMQQGNSSSAIVREQQPPIIPLHNNRLLRVAASILIAMSTIALAYFVFEKFSGPGLMQIATTTIVEKQELPDGSTVTLNKNSVLKFPEQFTGSKREVSLKGEGFFAIQPDKTKPFFVHVKDLTIMVVGTSFNIREINGNVEVIVETGIVQVKREEKTVELHPGEKVVANETDKRLEIEKQSDQLYNYYSTKTFTCNNTPLWKLIEVLNQAYGTQISIINPAIRNLPLTVTFEEEPIDNILRIISQTLDIQVEKTDGKINLK